MWNVGCKALLPYTTEVWIWNSVSAWACKSRAKYFMWSWYWLWQCEVKSWWDCWDVVKLYISLENACIWFCDPSIGALMQYCFGPLTPCLLNSRNWVKMQDCDAKSYTIFQGSYLVFMLSVASTGIGGSSAWLFPERPRLGFGLLNLFELGWCHTSIRPSMPATPWV